MISSSIQKISLSNEEVALVYSLINLPQVGKTLLVDAYGDLSKDQLEEKMITASHSLLARGAVHFSDRGTVHLDSSLEEVFYPLAQYKNMLQILLNNGEAGLSVIDNYISKRNTFTSNEVDIGVIHHIFHGPVMELSTFLQSRMKLPAVISNELEQAFLNPQPGIKLTDYSELEDKKSARLIVETLRAKGFNSEISIALSQDILAPVFRGSISVINISSDKPHPRVLQETGEGFIWLVGKISSWILHYRHGDEKAVATVLPGTARVAGQILDEMIKKMGL